MSRYAHIALLVVGYALVAVFLGLILKHDFLRSDVLEYWQSSSQWWAPFHPFHVPGYPLAIALLRGVFFKGVPPTLVMMTISFTAFLASAFLVHHMIRRSGVPDRYAVMGTYLFGLWPFVGLVNAVWPAADLPAMALLLLGLYGLLGSRRVLGGLAFGLALVTHKAMWPFVGLIVLADIFYRRPRLSWENAAALLALLLPIGILWVSGAVYHGSLTWIVSRNIQNEVMPRTSLPVLDGLLGTLMRGGARGVVKGATVAGVALLSAALVYASYRLRTPYFQFGMAISAGVLLLSVLMNRWEIWSSVRFGRLLVLPLMWTLGHKYGTRDLPYLRPCVVTAVLLALFVSQFAFSWYTARLYEWSAPR